MCIIIGLIFPYNPPAPIGFDAQEIEPLGHITSEASGVENSTGSKAGPFGSRSTWEFWKIYGKTLENIGKYSGKYALFDI